MVVRCCQAKNRNIIGSVAQVMLVGTLSMMVVPIAAGGTGGQEVGTSCDCQGNACACKKWVDRLLMHR